MPDAIRTWARSGCSVRWMDCLTLSSPSYSMRAFKVRHCRLENVMTVLILYEKLRMSGWL